MFETNDIKTKIKGFNAKLSAAMKGNTNATKNGIKRASVEVNKKVDATKVMLGTVKEGLKAGYMSSRDGSYLNKSGAETNAKAMKVGAAVQKAETATKALTIKGAEKVVNTAVPAAYKAGKKVSTAAKIYGANAKTNVKAKVLSAMSKVSKSNSLSANKAVVMAETSNRNMKLRNEAISRNKPKE